MGSTAAAGSVVAASMAHVAVLSASPPAQMYGVVSCIMNISWGLHEIYELKLMNDHKCNLMVQCLSQVLSLIHI